MILQKEFQFFQSHIWLHAERLREEKSRGYWTQFNRQPLFMQRAAARYLQVLGAATLCVILSTASIKEQAGQTDPLPPRMCGHHWEHMAHSTFPWYHCWDLFIPGALQGLGSSAASKISPCQLHSLWLSRDQTESFYQVHERQLSQCQCHSYTHSVLLGLVKMLEQNIFPFKKMAAVWPGTLLWTGWSCQNFSRNWQTGWLLAVIMALRSARLLIPWKAFADLLLAETA